MTSEPRDPPYPELKSTHTIAHTGRPFTDRKPPPAGPVWAAIEGLARYYVLLAAIDLDVFDTLERTGPSTAGELADVLDVSADHLGGLLDAVAVQGLLDRVRGRYELNDTARRYLLSHGPASMAALVPVAPGPHANWTTLADTVRKGRPLHPIEEDPAGFYVPLVEGTFATMLRCATRADTKVRYSALAAPRVLDLGAGGAPWAIAVLTHCPDATAVVNDLDGVIEVARRMTTQHGVADRCELRPGDYATIEIEPGAYDLVMLGHVCRTESRDGARRLIARAFEALAPGGRLLLTDYFADRERLAPQGILMGITMMASTVQGTTHSHGDVAGWLREAGFEAIRLVEPIGYQQTFVATRGSQRPGATGSSRGTAS